MCDYDTKCRRPGVQRVDSVDVCAICLRSAMEKVKAGEAL